MPFHDEGGVTPRSPERCISICIRWHLMFPETFHDLSQGVGPHLTRQSGNGMTILMHAARSGNAMALRVVAQAVRRVCHPHDVRYQANYCLNKSEHSSCTCRARGGFLPQLGTAKRLENDAQHTLSLQPCAVSAP